MRRLARLGALVAVVWTLGCGEAPTTPMLEPAEAAMSSHATARTAISGTLVSVEEEGPGSLLITPSGRCHGSDSPGHFRFTGDVVGDATVWRRVVNIPCAGPTGPGDRLTGTGTVTGTVTHDGRTGDIAGQWTTECRPDPSQPTGWSCDGVMNFKGSGGLEGVQIHVNWGPGWWPFPYEGAVTSS